MVLDRSISLASCSFNPRLSENVLSRDFLKIRLRCSEHPRSVATIRQIIQNIVLSLERLIRSKKTSANSFKKNHIARRVEAQITELKFEFEYSHFISI